MVRKALAFAVGFGLLSSAYALDMSGGGGAFLGSNFGGGLKASFPGITLLEANTPYTGGGVYGFLDAQYVEVSAGIMFTGGKIKLKSDLNDLGDFGGGEFDDDDFDDDEFDDMFNDLLAGEPKTSGTLLNLGLLFKYPFPASESVTLFTAAGFEYSICLSQKIEDEKLEKAGDNSRLWFKFGGGADFELSKNIYLRASLFYGIGMKNKLEKDLGKFANDMLEYMDDEMGGLAEFISVKAVTAYSLDIKAGIGFRF
ncbi:MAG: hypothetical protein LBB56_03880 [Chitinispirillales bacterium]|nr:hypothetical protein [Chitinispirillales bacterium]